MNETLTHAAATLASGTIASLTGYTLYSQVEVIQDAFVDFCEETEAHYTTWQDAWGAFWPLYKPMCQKWFNTTTTPAAIIAAHFEGAELPQ